MDKFFAHLKIAFFGGMVLACPWWLYQTWRFVAPGLYQKEKKMAIGFIVSGTGLFLMGIAFTYYIVLPTAFHFLMTYGGDVDKPMITIDQYMGFVTITGLAFGAAFELPLILVTLALLGIVDHHFLRKHRRYAVITIATISAILTPPDLLSMIMLLVPMVALYEISIIVIVFMARNKPVETEIIPE